MKYYVTGGAGFIGRELINQLLKDEHLVKIYDDFSFGNDFNIAAFKSNPNFSCDIGKIQEIETLKKSIQRFCPDIVVHLAALHFIPFCNSNPLGTLTINVNGTYALFEAIADLNIKRILFASSGAIYASSENELSEKNEIPEPVDVYGISKLMGENICDYFSRKYNIEVISMRFFNTYGPYETNPHLIPDILVQLKDGNTLKLGNTKTKRDYIYVEDMAKAVYKLSTCALEQKHTIVNVGTGIEYSAEEIVEKIANITKRNLTIETDPARLRKSDKMHQISSMKKLNDLIHWLPEHDLDKGLKKLLKFEGLTS